MHGIYTLNYLNDNNATSALKVLNCDIIYV